MIKLKEIFNTICEKETEGLVPIENWKLYNVEHLNDIGFTDDGMYHMSLKSPPMMISYKKGAGFLLNDKKKKKTHTFKRFADLCQHFENYEQQWDT